MKRRTSEEKRRDGYFSFLFCWKTALILMKIVSWTLVQGLKNVWSKRSLFDIEIL